MHADSFLNDFLQETPDTPHIPEKPQGAEPVVTQNVKIAASRTGIPAAQPKKYVYGEKFKKRTLSIDDVIPRKKTISKFKELPEIAVNSLKDERAPGSGFYGPGMERDI